MITPERIAQIRAWHETSEKGGTIIWSSRDIRDLLAALDEANDRVSALSIAVDELDTATIERSEALREVDRLKRWCADNPQAEPALVADLTKERNEAIRVAYMAAGAISDEIAFYQIKKLLDALGLSNMPVEVKP